MKLSCHMNACIGLHFRKLLSPPFGSGLAVPPKRRHHNRKDTQKQDLSATTAIPRGDNRIMVCSFFQGKDPVLGKSSSAAQHCPALGQGFSLAFGVKEAANTSILMAKGQQRHAKSTTPGVLQQINKAADTYSQHLHTRCRGFFLQALTSPFWGCFWKQLPWSVFRPVALRHKEDTGCFSWKP